MDNTILNYDEGNRNKTIQTVTNCNRLKPKKIFAENKIVAQKGGNVAKADRVQLENTTGGKVIANQNAKILSKNKNRKKVINIII